MIVQLETYESAYIYTSLPACLFDLDYVSSINNGELKCMMKYRTISEPRVSGIIHIYLYIDNVDILMMILAYRV